LPVVHGDGLVGTHLRKRKEEEVRGSKRKKGEETPVY
jgi:hypothetical protein